MFLADLVQTSTLLARVYGQYCLCSGAEGFAATTFLHAKRLAALRAIPRYPINGKTVGARNPKATSAAPIAPSAALNQTRAVIPVMIAADASTIAI